MYTSAKFKGRAKNIQFRVIVNVEGLVCGLGQTLVKIKDTEICFFSNHASEVFNLVASIVALSK